MIIHDWQDSTLGTRTDKVKSAWPIRMEMFNELAPEILPQLMPDRLVKVERCERVPKSWDTMKVKVSSLICSCKSDALVELVEKVTYCRMLNDVLGFAS